MKTPRFYPTLLACLLTCFSGITTEAQEPGTVEATVLSSAILKESRKYRVHLPASYRAMPTHRYPVLYIMDGDYNFHYVSGLLEQMASMSEQIPEVILVGISDRGAASYRRHMKPTLGTKDPGTASRFLDFLEKELVPKVDSKYRTVDFRMLMGHSLGGLFTINALLEKPDLFQAHIAISPSLWWDGQALRKHAKKGLKSAPKLRNQLYLSLASEQGMGVEEMVTLLEKAAPKDLSWKFRHFPTENHNSTGLPALRWALLDIFEEYELTEEAFGKLGGASDLLDHFQNLQRKHGVEFLLPSTILGQVMHSYHRKKKTTELETLETGIEQRFPLSVPMFQLAQAKLALDTENWQEALKAYQAFTQTFPHSFEGYWGAGMAHGGLGNVAEAKKLLKRAQQLATNGAARRWRLNQLEADQRGLVSSASTQE